MKEFNIRMFSIAGMSYENLLDHVQTTIRAWHKVNDITIISVSLDRNNNVVVAYYNNG